MTSNRGTLTWGRPDRTLEKSRTVRLARSYLWAAAAAVIAPILFLAPRESMTLWLALSVLALAGAFYVLQVLQSELLVSATFEFEGVILRRHDFTSAEGKEEIEKINWSQVKRLGYSNGMGEYPENLVFLDYSSPLETQVKTVQMKFGSQHEAQQFLNAMSTRFGFKKRSGSGSANYDLLMSSMGPTGTAR